MGGLQQRLRAQFMREQPPFGDEAIATRIAAKVRGGENPMARNDDGDRIVAIGLPDRSRAASGRARDVGIAARRAIRDRAKRLPDPLPIGGSGRGERQAELSQFPVEVGMELLAGSIQQRCRDLLAAPAPVDSDNGSILFRDGEIADRGMERKLRHHVQIRAPGRACCQVMGRGLRL